MTEEERKEVERNIRTEIFEEMLHNIYLSNDHAELITRALANERAMEDLELLNDIKILGTELEYTDGYFTLKTYQLEDENYSHGVRYYDFMYQYEIKQDVFKEVCKLIDVDYDHIKQCIAQVR